MGDLNKVMIIGRLTRDVELKYTPKGTAVTELSVATSRKTKQEGEEPREITTFVDVTVWGRQAEVVSQYRSKGSEIFIEGRLEIESWEDKTTGAKRTKLKVVCENLQLIGGKNQGAPQRTQSQATPAYTSQPKTQQQDGIPF